MRRTGWSKRLHQLWAWSLLVTVPVTGLFLVWLLAVVDRYQVLGLRLDVQGGEAHLLHPIMKYEWYLTKRRLGLTLVPRKASSGLRGVELWVSEGGENKLNRRLPGSGGEYAKAKIAHPDGSLGKASLRYRGDMMHHWALAKKSWRIKTKKKKLWNGIRKFNLIVPETWAVLEEHFGYRMATDLGLLAPVSEVIALRVNGENRGLHTLVGQVDELFLRDNQRMPGDLFVGELLLGDAIPGFENKVFDMPGMWSKAAINNHYDDGHAASMFRLCDVLDWQPGARKAQALGDLLDMQAMGRFSAYRALVQTGHVDSYHNWKLYYDPWRKRFEPVVWDPNAWGSGWAPTAQDPAFEWPLFSEFDSVLVHDHRYRWNQHKALVGFFAAGLGGRLLADMESVGAQVIQEARSDPALAFSILPSSPKRAAQAVSELRSRVQTYFDIFRTRHVQGPAQAVRGEAQVQGPGEWVLPVIVDGWKPIAAVRLLFSQDLPDGARFYWALRRAGEWSESPVQAVRLGPQVVLEQPLLPGVRIDPSKRGHSFTHSSSPRPLVYRLRMVLPGRSSLDLTDLLALDLAGEAHPIAIGKDADFSVGDLQGDFGELFRCALPAPTRWSGEIELQGVTEIQGDLLIEPGTLLSMEEGASVIVNGRVQALGTARDPIRFMPVRSKQEPWGTFALRTSRADGSVLEHVQFEGGSGYKDDLQEYSAMFSIHDVDGLRVKHCSFKKSKLVDDMVHVVYGQDLLFQDCLFERSLSDALDLDGCQGLVERCSFDRSGGDAIDLMMSQIEVRDTTIKRSFDKGVSVGERSDLLWSGGRLETCGIGIQVKDGSLTWIRGATFSANGQALHAYKKNWQYGDGGHGLVEDCEFQGNGIFVDADKHSSWRFMGGRSPELPEDQQRMRRVLEFAGQLPSGTRQKFEAAHLLDGALDS